MREGGIVGSRTKSKRKLVDVRPFRAWLRHIIEQERQRGSASPYLSAAARLGTAERTLRRLMSEGATVNEATVDRLVTHEGSWMSHEVLTMPYDPSAGEPDKPSQPVVEICSTPTCTAPRVSGRKFCLTCAQRLSTFRAELELEAQKRMACGTSIHRRHPRVPTCCTPGCAEPRSKGNPHCWDCRLAEQEEERDECVA